jgi:hypothetical protein
MIEMEDSPSEKKRLKDEVKEYMQTKRPVLEDIDTSEDEKTEPAEKEKRSQLLLMMIVWHLTTVPFLPFSSWTRVGLVTRALIF